MNSEQSKQSKKADSAQDIYQQLGFISSSFGWLELELRNSIALLIDDDYLQIGEMITGNLSFTQNIDLFAKIGHFRLNDKMAIEQLRDMLPRLREAGKKRNDVLHAAWGYYHDENHEKVYIGQRVRQKKGPSVEASSFEELIDFINKIAFELVNFSTDWL